MRQDNEVTWPSGFAFSWRTQDLSMHKFGLNLVALVRDTSSSQAEGLSR
jgi:hypothetical protein